MQSSSRHPLEHIPTSIVAVTQTAVGCGIGLLLAGKLPRTAQRTTAIAMLSVGAASLLPVIAGILARKINRPESARGMKRRLDSIREDSGLSESEDVF